MEVGDAALEKEPPAPLTIVHAPVPAVGVFAAKVAEVCPHKLSWSDPAAAVVGFLGKEIATSLEEDVQGELLIVHRKV